MEKQLINDIIGVLEDCQYADNSGEEYSPQCAICSNIIFDGKDHRNNCKLKMLLDKLRNKV